MPEFESDSERVQYPRQAPRFQVHAHCVTGHEVIVAMNPSMARMLYSFIYDSELDEDETALKALASALKHAKSEYHNKPNKHEQG